MTSTAELSERSLLKTSPRQRAIIMAAIALVSCASLLLELGLTRLFSVILFYHFAFLAISVALLGLGAGGVFAYIKKDWLTRWSLRQLGARLCALNAVVILAALEVVLHIPISLELTRGNFGKLTILYLASAVPFFFTGLLFSTVFARETEGIGLIYGADLAGGSMACMAVVPLLNFVGGPNAILASAVMMAAAAAIWAETGKTRKLCISVAAALLLLIAANHSGKLIDIIYAKGMRRDQPWMLYSRWNAISRVEVNQVGEAKYIVIDADASTAIMNVDPAKWDHSAVAPRNLNLVEHLRESEAGYNWKNDLMSAAPAMANVLRPNGKFAIIGPGGGVDVLRAVANGSKDVTGIEINPIIATTIMRGRYADYAYHLYERPEVRIHVGDGRSFIRNSKEQYDVVQMTLVDTWASTAAGAFALSENNLYTEEAFEEYFQHLRPDGFIAITRWEFKEPREALRVVAQGMEALHRLGVQNPAEHFIVVSDGELNRDGRPVLVLAKKSPFTAGEIAAVKEHLSVHSNLHALYLPGAGTTLFPSLQKLSGRYAPADASMFGWLIHSNNPTGFAQAYWFNVAPVYDSAPFFFFTLKTKDVVRQVLNGTGAGMDWRINLGVTVLFMVLALSILAVFAFLVLPLMLHKRPAGPHRKSPPWTRLFYFVAVGLGFIMVEISLIQRFVLFLGHPTYALTVVVFLMLLSSGAGSLTARRWIPSVAQVWMPLLGIVSGTIAYIFILPVMLSSLVGLAFPWKLMLSAVVIAPLGYVMGMPFPTGLRALSEISDRRVEWAWAMNASASVLGSVTAMIIAIHFGLNVTLLCGAAAYLMAAFMAGSFRPVATA